MLPEPDLDEAIGRDPSIWNDFRGATVLFTGGTGFIGSWMVATLRRASAAHNLGCRIIILTRDPDSQRIAELGLSDAPDVVLVRGDVRQPLCIPGPLTHVVLGATAASAKLTIEQPLTMLDTIVEGARHTLACAQRCGARRVLFLSSGAVYGKIHSGPVDEGCRLGPDTLDAYAAYSEGKRLAEQLCAIHGSQESAPAITIARCFAFVGPLLPLGTHFAIGNFIADALAGRPITIQGDGTAVRSYMYAGDLAAWLWTIMVRGQHLRAYNVGAEAGHDLRSVATLVAGLQTPALPVIVRGISSGMPADIYVPDTTLAQRDLGLRTWTALHTAVARTITWHHTRRHHLGTA